MTKFSIASDIRAKHPARPVLNSKKISAAEIVENHEWLNESPQISETAANNSHSIVKHYVETSLILSEIMKRAGFSGNSINFVQLIFQIIGENSEWHLLPDAILKERSRKSVESVRRWRKSFKTESTRLNFTFIELIEGEYDSGKQRYQSLKYRIPQYVFTALNDAVTELLIINPSQKERHAVAVSVADKHFNNFPGAKSIKLRKTSPRRRDGFKVYLDRFESKVDRWKETGKLEAEVYNDYEAIREQMVRIVDKVLQKP